MPKVGAVKKTKTKKKKAGPDVCYSDELEEQQEVIVIHGGIGSGKTTMALSASEFAPSKWVQKKGRGKLIDLADMFWLQYDVKALAGARILGVRVPVFNVIQYMVEHNCDIIQATEAGLNAAIDSKAKFLVPDTITAFDAKLLAMHMRDCVGHPNKYEAYKLNLAAHAEFTDAATATGMHIIYLTHTRRFDRDADERGQNKAAAITVVGGAELLPDITGQAPKFYKRDATLQIVMKAFKDPKTRKIVREAHIGVNDEGEGKNRYEGLLPDVQSPPHLRKLLEMAWRG
jgi:hypothetical protein